MVEEIAGGLTRDGATAGEVTMQEYMASLRYAGMIQNSLLPLPSLMNMLFSDYFVTYMPRDIVSGDFYYVYRGRNFFCVAAGDCTGHGVPGALLSILGLGFLNEILQCQTAPRANRVLNQMREKMMSALHQTGKLKETRDSIDMGLCIFSYTSNEMQFSSANRPLFMVSDGELREIRADRMPIGLAPLREEPFSNNMIRFSSSDMFYMFSDGFPDQFGGSDDKKYKYSRLRSLLTQVASHDASKQKLMIEKEFLEWKGSTQQVDDVMVFGFKPLIRK